MENYHSRSRPQLFSKLQSETGLFVAILGVFNAWGNQIVKVQHLSSAFSCKRRSRRASGGTASPGRLRRAWSHIHKIGKVEGLTRCTKIWENTTPRSGRQRRKNGMLAGWSRRRKLARLASTRDSSRCRRVR